MEGRLHSGVDRRLVGHVHIVAGRKVARSAGGLTVQGVPGVRGILGVIQNVVLDDVLRVKPAAIAQTGVLSDGWELSNFPVVVDVRQPIAGRRRNGIGPKRDEDQRQIGLGRLRVARPSQRAG